jgi:hypothetical protein
MKSLLRITALSLLLLTPLAAAHAQAPSVSPISDVSLNAGATLTLNVVAFCHVGDAITLTASLPAFATLNAPTSGTGVVVTTITLAPTAANTGTFNASVTATIGSMSSTETFQIVVNATGSARAPVVTAPAIESAVTGANLSFTVSANDADGDAITSLTAVGLPTGASFTPNGTFTSGTFSWTPGSAQVGEYNVVFTAANALSGSATTHIHVSPTVSIAAIADLTITEGASVNVNVNAVDVGDNGIALTASLPAFATLNSPTTGTGAVATTITIAPGTGTAGGYNASVTASANGQTVTRAFTITVLAAGGGGGAATVTLIGQINTHNDRTCFRIQPVNSSFDVRNVTLSSITLDFGGASIAALAGSTHLQLDCEEGDGDGDGEGCGACDSTGHHEDAARLRLGGDHPRGGTGDDNEGDCEECDHDSTGDQSNCPAVGIKACFSTQALITLFGDAVLPVSLADATIHLTLVGGGTVVGTFNGSALADHDHDKSKKGLNPHARPNPLNPRTQLTFTLSRGGRVQVSVYDTQGRLVSKVLDEVRPAGQQSLTWDGSNSRNAKVASGVYFFRIQAPEGQAIQRVAVVK